ncbi:hypothetical protein AGABI1DRAFT_115660 [Agaricus bisporus var. burnettii JB137-S8]|uniref:Uncharacterized protein n=1 Tax=Agaricus bisporus var. burnettii (strain JB137-S8 / ATCC MYA-4627 / FGSC 10392) TaxID=597362 RepID=K5VQQ2_AGABU|nr:uncharacterized protein AGABI1DRAFT_115660 [Agaricus bisporus var. burnettii JB137-S8]EKM76799.1 hypothetical protein AGABI1DRAFT_115660 [Agaricus bisporus var. burnettii JB137-S8]
MLSAQEAVNWHWLQCAKAILQRIKGKKTAGKDLEEQTDSSSASTQGDERSETSDDDHSEFEWRVRGPITPRAKDLRSRKVDNKTSKQPSPANDPGPSAAGKTSPKPNSRPNILSNLVKFLSGK